MLGMESAGRECFDLWTRSGGFAGLIAKSQKYGHWSVYFNMTATRGSARKFASAEAAVAYVVARRIKKGWRV